MCNVTFTILVLTEPYTVHTIFNIKYKPGGRARPGARDTPTRAHNISRLVSSMESRINLNFSGQHTHAQLAKAQQRKRHKPTDSKS